MKRALISAAVTAAAVTLSATPAFASQVTTPTTVHHHHRAKRPHSVVVAPGQSFWSIGNRWGVNMIDLANYNGMDYEAPLDAGITLKLPRRGWTGPMAGSASVSPASASSTPVASAPAASPAYGSAPYGIWSCIAEHESGDDPAADTGNGYYGMYQFSLGTWYANGGAGNPADASVGEQTAVAERVLATQGWGAWPVTSYECGV